MAGTDAAFVGSIPDIYDTYMVPLIFERYAEDLAERALRENALSVLETAAGSGVVTRALARRLPANARIIATDLNPPMLARAQSRQADDARIRWQPCDAMKLPFGAAEFDAVICQFGSMFFPDKIAAYREALRVLRPGGVLLMNIWDSIEANPFPYAVLEVVAQAFPDDPPDFMRRVPHGHGNPDRIRADLEEAGYNHVTILRMEFPSTAEKARDVAVAFCQGTPMRSEIESRDANRLAEITDAAEAAVASRWGSGPVASTISAYVIEARRSE